HDRVRALLLDEPLEVAAPARGHEAPDRLAGHAIAARVLGGVLLTAQVPVALEAGGHAPHARVRLTLEVGRVRGAPPPWRLDRPPAIPGDDELGALVVQR